MEKFDLTRALAGEPIVDTQGMEYNLFALKQSEPDGFDYMAYESGNRFWFNKYGQCHGASSRNLFMKNSKQKTMKPFDLKKALAGSPVLISIQLEDGKIWNAKGYYRFTTQRKGLHHHAFEVENECHNWVYMLDNYGLPALSEKQKFIGIYMAPKNVKYYFASWARDIEDPGDRAASCLFLSKDALIREMGGKADYLIHEIEIEE